jgi:hypothetical protein
MVDILNSGIDGQKASIQKGFNVGKLKNMENWVAWFLAELCKAETGVQKDKRNQHWTELVRACLAPHIAGSSPAVWEFPSAMVGFPWSLLVVNHEVEVNMNQKRNRS